MKKILRRYTFAFTNGKTVSVVETQFSAALMQLNHSLGIPVGYISKSI